MKLVSEKLKVYMHFSESSAVGYYRIWQPEKWLNRLGLANVKRLPDDKHLITPFNKSDANPNRSQEELIEWADLLVYQRRNTRVQHAVLEAILEKFNKPVVYELDDDLINIDNSHPQYNVYREKSASEAFDVIKINTKDLSKYQKAGKILQVGYPDPPDGTLQLMLIKDWDLGWLLREYLPVISAITVTCEALKEVYVKYNPNVYVLPNCIDFELWDGLRPQQDYGYTVLGWAGGFQHLRDMDRVLAPVIDIILNRFPDVRFHYVRCQSKELQRLERKYPNQVHYIGAGCPISEWPKTYNDWQFDIGLAPLYRSKFNEGKSNLKWLENSARKIPTVASDIRTYSEIEQGVTGYKCRDTNDWVNALIELIKDKKKRKTMGQKAYDYIKSNYDAKDNAPRYLRAYQDILTKHKEKKHVKHVKEAATGNAEKRDIA